jgi:flagellar hook protein FlgE
MSLFSALTVAVGGLNAQSRSIGHISDNISNASTVGYKRIDTQFESLVTQSNLTINDPGGVAARPDYQNTVQGNLVQSQSATSLAISGNGFFAVGQPEVSSSGIKSFTGEDLYTRRGDFKLDKDGFMVNGAGYVLKGYAVDSTGAVDTSTASAIQVSALLDNPVATTDISFAGNLPASADFSESFPESSIQIFDALGAKHSMSLKWTKGASTDPANTWYLDITPTDAVAAASFTDNAGATVAAGAAIGTQRLTFTFGSTTNATQTTGTVNVVANTGSGNLFTIDTPTPPENLTDVTFNAAFAGAGSQAITINFGQYDKSVGVTQFDGSNIAVTSFEQNGIPRGSFRDLQIDENGFVILNYDNGRSRTLYQVPIVQFNSPNSLQRVDGGAYARTNESGTARFSSPGNVGAGTIVGNTLEGSNVDIADEFTKMIQAQRIYSANARTITTANGMLEEVINIVR